MKEKKTQTIRITKRKDQIKKIRGITLIALVITIVLNCYRSGRKLEYAM